MSQPGVSQPPPDVAPHSPDVAPEHQQAMVTILGEQRRAVVYLCANPGDRGARQWLEDWIAEEVLLRLEQCNGIS